MYILFALNDIPLDPAGIYLLKVNNRNTRPCSSVSIVNFEHVIAGWGCSKVLILSFLELIKI